MKFSLGTGLTPERIPAHTPRQIGPSCDSSDRPVTASSHSAASASPASARGGFQQRTRRHFAVLVQFQPPPSPRRDQTMEWVRGRASTKLGRRAGRGHNGTGLAWALSNIPVRLDMPHKAARVRCATVLARTTGDQKPERRDSLLQRPWQPGVGSRSSIRSSICALRTRANQGLGATVYVRCARS